MAIPVLDEQCQCDVVAQSAYGIVEDDEVVVRILTDSHFNGAKLQTSAFKLTDIIADGVSMSRLRMMDVAEFQAVAEDIRRLADAVEVKGAFAIQAAALRALRDENGNRTLCLFDDPVISHPGERDNPAHCMAVSPNRIERADAQEIRFHLMTIFREARYLHELWELAA
ncbi:hypothetical protein [Sphingomonas melonis]|uniref:Uncharacterized protein n=1 Tax=Sphingomonas melonis TaxID=152682 RepID=A0A7Y9FQ74_9SPHN|nr:hypothetical protein [Sphingomonas melonis]NYD91451.1 hypothetical protein [Sphingomonas melonis]